MRHSPIFFILFRIVTSGNVARGGYCVFVTKKRDFALQKLLCDIAMEATTQDGWLRNQEHKNANTE